MNKDNFDGVRIGLAVIVVFAHLFFLTQLQEFASFALIFDADFAVKGFFAISGFLVTQSYLASSSIREYAEKRLRRIYPAYLASVLLSLAIGVYATTLSLAEFFTSPQTLKYLVANAVFLNFLQTTLPSALAENPIQMLNGSLWTIKVEVALYFCVPATVYLYRKFGSTSSAVVLILLSITWVYFFVHVHSGITGAAIARQFPGQLSYFVAGSLLSVNAQMLSRIKWIAAASLVALLSTDNPYVRLVLDPIAYSAIVIFLSTSAFKSLNFGKYGDISYGIYLYHFPIIQLLIFLGIFKSNAWLGVVATFFLAILAALVSWHAVEKPLLRRGSHYVVIAAGSQNPHARTSPRV